MPIHVLRARIIAAIAVAGLGLLGEIPAACAHSRHHRHHHHRTHHHGRGNDHDSDNFGGPSDGDGHR